MALRLRSTTLGRMGIASSMQKNAFRSHTFQRPAAKAFSSSSGASSSSSSSTSFWSRTWDKYTEALIARPLLVKGSAAFLIFLSSDTATQKLTDPASTWDASRALSGAGFGVVATCWLHYWWGFLEVVVNKRVPVGSFQQNKLLNALGKVLADQLIGAPLYIYTYYCATHFGKEWVELSKRQRDKEQGTGIEKEIAPTATNAASVEPTPSVTSLMKETSDRALEMLPDTLWRHWSLWPIVHTLNFYYNPLHHRVLVQNIVLIFWSGYLSHLNNGGLMTPEAEVELAASEKLKRRATQSQRNAASAPQDTPLATSTGKTWAPSSNPQSNPPKQEAPLAATLSGRTWAPSPTPQSNPPKREAPLATTLSGRTWAPSPTQRQP